MFERIKMFLKMSISPSKGVIKMDDTRMFAAPTSLLVHTRNKIRDIGPTGDRFLYEAGKEAGKDFSETLDDVFDAEESPSALVKKAPEFGAYTGWGKIEVIDMDMENNFYRLRIQNGFFDTDGEELTPYTAGMLAGAAEKILDRDMDVKKDTEASDEETDYFDMKPAEDLQVSWSS